MPFTDPEFQRWADEYRDRLVATVEGSRLVVSLVSDEPDVKIAIEFGLAVLLDKPIIAVVHSGARIPEHLARVADEIVEDDFDVDGFEERLSAAMDRAIERYPQRSTREEGASR